MVFRDNDGYRGSVITLLTRAPQERQGPSKNIDTQQTWSGFSPTTFPDNNRQSGLLPTTFPEISIGYLIYHTLERDLPPINKANASIPVFGT